MPLDLSTDIAVSTACFLQQPLLSAITWGGWVNALLEIQTVSLLLLHTNSLKTSALLTDLLSVTINAPSSRSRLFIPRDNMAALPSLPPQFKPIQHYLKTAAEHDKRDPVVAYYCKYVSSKIISISKFDLVKLGVNCCVDESTLDSDRTQTAIIAHYAVSNAKPLTVDHV